MDNDPRIRAQAEKLADRNDEWDKKNNETVRELIRVHLQKKIKDFLDQQNDGQHFII